MGLLIWIVDMVCSMISSELSSAFILPVEADHSQHSSPAEAINLMVEVLKKFALESYCSLSSRCKKSLQP